MKNLLRENSPSQIAWIGSIQLFSQFSAGVLSGPINDKFGPRVSSRSHRSHATNWSLTNSKVIIMPFCLLLTLSVMLTSICKEYYQFILCQGVLGGVSSGLVYAPSIAVIGHYFHRKRPMAMGITASGSAIAGILLPIIIDRLLNHTNLGFGWTQRIVGFIFLAFSLLTIMFVKPNTPPRKGTYFLPEAFKKWAYNFQVIGLFLVFLGLFTPLFYLPAYAQQHGVGISLSFYLIAIVNAGSFVGRLTAGGLGVSIGQFNVLMVCCAAVSILVFSWLRIESNAALIVFAALYGVFSGGIIGTMISTLAQVASHPNQIGTYIGMSSGILAIAALTGAPITGAMISHYGGYKQAIYFSGVVSVVGTFFMVCARFAYAPRTTWRA
jgi:MFS family permease